MLTSDVIRYIDKSVLCWLATSDADNYPNVSPKEAFTHLGEEYILIANIASPQTVQNILSNDKICLSFVEVFVQKGYQIKGTASIIDEKDDEFDVLAEPLLKMTKGKFPFSSLTKVKVEKVKPIIAPSYYMFPDTTEAQQVESAIRTYGR